MRSDIKTAAMQTVGGLMLFFISLTFKSIMLFVAGIIISVMGIRGVYGIFKTRNRKIVGRY